MSAEIHNFTSDATAWVVDPMWPRALCPPPSHWPWLAIGFLAGAAAVGLAAGLSWYVRERWWPAINARLARPA